MNEKVPTVAETVVIVIRPAESIEYGREPVRGSSSMFIALYVSVLVNVEPIGGSQTYKTDIETCFVSVAIAMYHFSGIGSGYIR